MLRLPNVEKPEFFGDWLEASLLEMGADAHISDSDVQDVATEAGYPHEIVLEQTIQQVHQRRTAIGDRYPIARLERGFRSERLWSDSLEYSFLLFVSLNQSYRELKHAGTASTPAELFEFVVAGTLENVLGGKAIRIGAPRKPPVPAAFPAALDYLAAAIRESRHVSGDLERQNSGDDGLDVWVIKDFDDARTSNLFVVAQCAIGLDWAEKRSELDLDLWRRHIDWYTAPIKAFAVPFQIPHESWRETATRGGLVLDRPRIAKWCRFDLLPAAIRNQIRAWTNQRITRARTIASM